ncbi:MAG: hypothetical protein R2867_27320 [Caldilineaceae bacterium]
MRRQFAQDVPRWSAFVQQEAARFALAYIDTSGNFSAHLQAAEALLRAE